MIQCVRDMIGACLLCSGEKLFVEPVVAGRRHFTSTGRPVGDELAVAGEVACSSLAYIPVHVCAGNLLM